jgi:hypothetical protein
MTESESIEWTYRGIDCKIISVPITDEYLGYAMFGDKQVRVVDDSYESESAVKDDVELQIDMKLRSLTSDSDQRKLKPLGTGFDDLFDDDTDLDDDMIYPWDKHVWSSPIKPAQYSTK